MSGLCLFGLLSAVLILPAGCSYENRAPIEPDSHPVTVAGSVTRIVNGPPADQVTMGNVVEVHLELDNGNTDVLCLVSSVRAPLTQEQRQAYQLIQQLKPGDRVQGSGERAGDCVLLGSLTRL